MGNHTSLEVDDPVAVLTLRRPEKLNAFTDEMLGEVYQSVLQAMNDPAVVGLVVTGEGRGFCAGLDAAALADATEAGSSVRTDEPGDLPGLFSYLLEQPKPIIAAVNGVAAGGGFVLACKCDLRFASTEASFVSVFSKRGLIAEHGTTWMVPRLVGTGNALDLLWSSRRVDAEEALRMGLVQRVVEPGRVVDEAAEYLRRLSEEVAPWSLQQTKRLVYGHLGADAASAFAEADDVGWSAMDRPDAAEGAAALVERRAPKFERVS